MGVPQVTEQPRVETGRLISSRVHQVYRALCPSQGNRQAKRWAANCTPVLARVRPARVRKASYQAKLQRMRHQIAGLGSLSADRRRGGVKISSPPPHTPLPFPLPHASWPMKRERGSHVGPESFRAWQNVNEKEERDSKVPPTPRSARESERAWRLALRGPQESERASERRGTERRQAGLSGEVSRVGLDHSSGQLDPMSPCRGQGDPTLTLCCKVQAVPYSRRCRHRRHSRSSSSPASTWP